MNRCEEINPQSPKEHPGQMHTCDAAPPDFQRTCVEKPQATQALIVIIASNDVAGRRLRVRNTRLSHNAEFEWESVLLGVSAMLPNAHQSAVPCQSLLRLVD